MAAYEDMIRHTSTPEAPWFVVPADNKWFTRVVIAAAISEMGWGQFTFDSDVMKSFASKKTDQINVGYDLLPALLGRQTPALLVNSGSSANLIAVSSLGSTMLRELDRRPIKKGDEIITAAAGFPTTVNPIIQNGWVPLFVDVDFRTLNVLPE